MEILRVKNLCKKYPAFTLDNVSFTVPEGSVTGFIGRNGAGKSTTLKSVLGLVHSDSGSAEFFGKDFSAFEREIKQDIGYVAGGSFFYPNKPIKAVTVVTKRFYENWDDKLFNTYIQKFALDESKTLAQLSEGMKIKYALALALSHRAKLLILDEPTSGLDPVSRDELLDIFIELAKNGTTVLFSTHITSDLEKSADSIIYIRSGKIANQDSLKNFTERYTAVQLTESELAACDKTLLIGCKPAKEGYTAIALSENSPKIKGRINPADLEKIMIHLERE